jgi:predicted Zn-dependent protease
MTFIPDKSFELYQAARAHMEGNELAKAIELFRRSIDASPHFKTLELLGECLLKENKPADAIVELERSVSLNSRPARGYYLLAVAYAEVERKIDALAAANKCLEIQPDFERARKLKESLQSLI